MGIEPTALAWEARVLPLYDARSGCLYTGSLGGNEACTAAICGKTVRGGGIGHGLYGQRVLQVQLRVVAAMALRLLLQETQQRGLALQPGAFVLHVEEVPGVV